MDDRYESETDNSWDSSLYDDSHSFVYEYGEELLDLLSPEEGESVLDLGCGTGHLTKLIDESGSEVVAIDNAHNMLVQAKKSHPHLSFVQTDARRMSLSPSFDAVFSNAALHWIQDQEAVLKCVYNRLKTEGRFVAELGGKGNVEIIIAAMDDVISEAGYEVHNPWYFPNISEYTSLLESQGFEPTYARLFDRPTELNGGDGLRNWLAMFTDSFFADVPATEQEQLFEIIEDRLRSDLYNPDSDAWVADYRRLRFKAYRR